MLLLKYLNEKEKYLVAFNRIAQNVIELVGDFPINTNGFELSRLPEDAKVKDKSEAEKFWDGFDYSRFTTVYREIDGRVQFSNDGSVYIEPEPEPEPYVPTLEEVQEAKVTEMNAIQKEAIAAGVNVTLTDGSIEHFTLTDHDQISLMGLQSQVLSGAEQIPWHTSNEAEHCKLYDNADMALITAAAMSCVTWHVTYFRDLRIYIRSLDSKEAVEAVTYGMEIPEEYRSDPLQKMMEEQNV